MIMIVKIKKLSADAVIPVKAYERDFCYDVVAVSEEEVAPNVWKYGLGFALEIDSSRAWSPNTRYAVDFRPRSSVWKTGMVLSNCEGTIDEGYRGEVCAVFYHVMPEMPRYRVGDRIGQIKIGSTVPIEFVEVEELSASERGEKGYGSSGTGIAREGGN